MGFPPLPELGADQLEQQLLDTWKAEDLFRQSMAAGAGGAPFVFYEGPPTANGRPGIHHVFSRTIKDLVCRFRAMQGRSVTRIAGPAGRSLAKSDTTRSKLAVSMTSVFPSQRPRESPDQ